MTAAAASARPASRFGHPEVFALLFALTFLVARFTPVLSLGLPCPLRTLAGIPCATCGMTRAFVALAHGRLAAAWEASPLGAALAAGIWLFAVADAARVARGWPLPDPGPRAWRLGGALALGALLANWAWLVFRGGVA